LELDSSFCGIENNDLFMYYLTVWSFRQIKTYILIFKV